VGEVPLPSYDGVGFIKNGQKQFVDHSVEIHRFTATYNRPVVAVSLGPHIEGAALPHPDPGHSESILQGALFRFARRVEYSDEFLLDFEKFVASWCEKNITPLSPDADTSVQTWLEATNYSQNRKDELLKVYLESNTKLGEKQPPEVCHMKSFMKDEHYVDWKYPRPINSRSDLFKCLVGPIVQLLNESLFKMKYFIKKIPVAERPDFILKTFEGCVGKTYVGDFTSYEAHFIKKLMIISELHFMRVATRFLPDGPAFYDLMVKAKTGLNRLKFKWFTMLIEAKRMSGEMDTSLSNSFMTLMIILYVVHKETGCSIEEIIALIEGDDSIFNIGRRQLLTSHFTDRGLLIKLLEFDSVTQASFCGMVFDTQDKSIITDPIVALIKMGWTKSLYAQSKPKVLLSLLRAKALSAAYQYNGCPIISIAARAFIRLTEGVDVKTFLKTNHSNAFELYKIDRIYEAIEWYENGGVFREPAMNTRYMVEELYGITVDTQFQIEKIYKNKNDLLPIKDEIFTQFFQVSWKDYYNRYNFNVDVRQFMDGSTLFPQRPQMYTYVCDSGKGNGGKRPLSHLTMFYEMSVRKRPSFDVKAPIVAV